MTTKHTCGQYRGINWIHVPHCQVLPYADRPVKSKWYFTLGADGKPLGDAYRTLSNLESDVDFLLAKADAIASATP